MYMFYHHVMKPFQIGRVESGRHFLCQCVNLVFFADISQRVLTEASVFHMLRSHLQAKTSSTAATSAFLLLTICTDNGMTLRK